ncbi:hypothetical protein [Pseudomonas sp. B10]|uniref:hypothetical protein n=1 Tax=Pseudomonas sp. B10 TaxID=118613 RepID=UPI000971133D|nr:hypothetical protein [Pseudomonas sp. B10]
MNSEDTASLKAPLTFKCLSHNNRDDGSVARYDVEVTDTQSGKIATISVEPRHLASARSMKTILLDRCMLYSASQKKHDQILLEMFECTQDQIESEYFC